MHVLFEARLEAVMQQFLPDNLFQTIITVFAEEGNEITAYELGADKEEQPIIVKSEIDWNSLDELLDYYEHQTYFTLIDFECDKIEDALKYLSSKRDLSNKHDSRENILDEFKPVLNEIPIIALESYNESEEEVS